MDEITPCPGDQVRGSDGVCRNPCPPGFARSPAPSGPCVSILGTPTGGIGPGGGVTGFIETVDDPDRNFTDLKRLIKRAREDCERRRRDPFAPLIGG